MELSKELGRTVKDLQDRPTLFVHLLPIWEAFNWLSGSRQYGFSVGPIPFFSIVEYLQFEGIQDKDRQWRWLRLIQALDFAWLDSTKEEK